MNIMSALEEANNDLRLDGLNATIMLVGGSALAILLPRFRETIDADIFFKSQSNLSQVKAIFEQYKINDQVKHIGFIPTPDEFIIQEELSLSNLTVLIPSLEDLALMKLFSSRPKDLSDLEEYILPVIADKNKLFERAKTYESSYVGLLEQTNYSYLKNKYYS